MDALKDKQKVINGKWSNLLSGEDFTVVTDYIENRISVLSNDNDRLCSEASMDVLVKINANLMRINELKAFIKKAEYEKRRLVK